MQRASPSRILINKPKLTTTTSPPPPLHILRLLHLLLLLLRLLANLPFAPHILLKPAILLLLLLPPPHPPVRPRPAAARLPPVRLGRRRAQEPRLPHLRLRRDGQLVLGLGHPPRGEARRRRAEGTEAEERPGVRLLACLFISSKRGGGGAGYAGSGLLGCLLIYLSDYLFVTLYGCPEAGGNEACTLRWPRHRKACMVWLV